MPPPPGSPRPPRPRRTTGLALVLLALLPTMAAAERLPFRQYRNSDGLPQSQVLSLLQDRRGEIWTGTYTGSARFDGARFHPFLGGRDLPSDYVWAIAEDPATGDLWVVADHALLRVSPSDLSKAAEIFGPLVPPPSDSPIRDLMVDRRGVLWAATQRGGLVVREKGTFRALPGPELEADTASVLAEGAPGEILMGTVDGIFRAAGNRLVRWRDEKGPWNETVRLLASIPGGLVLGTATESWRIAGSGAATPLRSPTGEPIPAARAALVDRRGRLWLGTESGLWSGSPAGPLVRIGIGEGMPSERIYALLEDRDGNVWIGTDNGLVRHPGPLFRTWLAADGLTDESVWSVGSDPEGRVLVGTRSGVFRVDDGKVAPLPGGAPLAGRMIRAIGSTPSGTTWFGTRNDGLLGIGPDGWRQFAPPEFPGSRVYDIFVDREGATWVGTQAGVARIDAAGAVRFWRRDDGLPSETIWMVGQAPDGRILATGDRGLAVLDGDRWIVPPELSLFAGRASRSFAFQKDGTLWVGTNGRGVYRRPPGGEWENLRAGSGPSDDFVWGICVDARDRVWIGTNHGLDRFDGARWANISERDGLVADEIAVNGLHASPDGAVWVGFGGGAGVTRFDPEPGLPEPKPPLVRVVSVVTSGGRTLTAPRRVELPWDERDVTFSWIGVTFRDEGRVRYRVFLEGYDRQREAPTAERSVRYTNLPPRNYRFTVEAAGADGAWSREPATVELVILPPFWMTWWFRLLALAAAAAALFALGAWRLRRVFRQQALLEGQVRERTRTLEEKMTVIEDLKKKYEVLSTTDSLTGLANRRFFLERIGEEIGRARRRGEGIGLVLIDLDHFKAVNDRHGHQAGDDVLVAVARLLEEWFRSYDLVARWGGEEFIVAFLGSDRAGALDRMERLRQHVAGRSFVADGNEVRLTLSAGFVWHDFGRMPSTAFDDIARSADQRLYRAKEEGRNRIVSSGENGGGGEPFPAP